MRHSFLRVLPAILGCVAVACAGGEDDTESTVTDTATLDTGVEVSIDSSMDSSVPEEDAFDAADSSTDDATPETKPAVCGNGEVEGSEECDDNNLKKDDGCSNTCKLESKGPGDICPGIPVTITLGTDGKRTASVTGDTTKMYSHDSFSCGGGSATDLVYAVTSSVAGNVRLKLDADFPAVLATRKTCADSTTELSCNSKAEPGATSGFVSLAAGETVYVFVDGVGGLNGTFTLNMEQTASFCGDGIAEAPEQCDDGNTVAGDGCSSKCALESTPSAEVCPGPLYTFSGTGTTPRKISFAGDLTAAKNDFSTSFCTGGSLGFDHAYQIVPDVTGSLAVELRASYLGSAVYLRRECGNVTENRYDIDCATTKTLAPARFTAPVMKGVPLWLVVDSQGLSVPAGPYSVDAVLTPASCGNGVLDGGEQCDDGNTAAGDGCKADCTLEPMTGDKCADAEALALTAKTDGTHGTSRMGSTTGLANDFVKIGCEWSGNNGSPDAVYKVTAPIDGLLTAKLDPNFPAQLSIRATCVESVAGTAADCKLYNGAGPITHTMPVVTGNTYYVIIDGPSSTSAPQAGSYLLDVSIKPGTCGNGVVEGTETCDDGATTAGDGCDATCTLETPGPGSTCLNPSIITLTDDGAGLHSNKITFGTTNLSALKSFTSLCPSAGREAFFKVTAPVTGNLFAEVTGATFDATLGARSSCSPDTGDSNRLACSAFVKGIGDERFGIPVVKDQTYILVVDGATAADYGRFDLKVTVAAPRCGDLVVNTGEECDDGNTTSGDGCASDCKAEPIVGVDTCPGAPLTLTGTGSSPRTATVKFSTSTLSPDYVSTCGGNSRDGVFKIVPDISGELELQLTGTFNTNLYARSICDKVLSEYGCASTNDSTTGTRLVRFPVSAKAPIYVFVDGRDGESGFATLSVKLTP